MRNLKKILALVLAMIMSLSLMATAGATEFKDDDQVSETYLQAKNILSDLGVFNGDQNGNFNPTAPITRAEVAAIIYRITTGDTGVEQHKTYAPYNQFPDVDVEDWFAGYVTYCANAGYIKGRNTGKFDPKDSVTGYEVLAMILRAVGYDKNNEFVGGNWQKNTASIATQRGVLKNVLKDPAVRLSEPATRQVVAELLFQASFINQVTWNAATLSYREDGLTLAKEHLGTEKVTGVIMANQWANINDSENGGGRVLAEGKTELKPEGEGEVKNLTLDIASALEAVGLTYSAYIQNGTRVLGELEYSDVNVDNSNNGAAKSVGAVANGLNTGSATYFLNYNEDWDEWDESDYLVRYAIAQADCGDGSEGTWKYYIEHLVDRDEAGNLVTAGHSFTTRTIKIKDANGVETLVPMYVVSIAPESRITRTDLAIMKSIFYTADRTGSNTDVDGLRDYVTGEVYIGTASLVDESDTLSWKEFTQKYFWQDGQRKYDGCENGESLRVIDNNGDGKAEYVFKVQYWQDQAIGTYRDALEFNDEEWNLYYADKRVDMDEIDVGDVVNYTFIDGLVTMWKADVVNGTVSNKNFRDVTIAVNGETYGQSGIFNHTGMDELIMQTADVTEYNFYLDEFGYIRSYKLAQGNKYALVTEMYNTTNQAFNYVNTGRWIAEIVAGTADPAEYNLANAGSLANNNLNPFISQYAWTNRVTRYNNTDLNFLQPAIAHLAVRPSLFEAAPAVALPYIGATGGTSYAYELIGTGSWNRGVFEMVPSIAGGTNYGVFDYGAVAGKTYNGAGGSANNTPVDHSFSFTNVAAYALDDNGNVTLNTATKLMTNNKGEQLYYGPSYRADGTVAYAYGQRMTINEWAEYNQSKNIAAADTVAEMETLIRNQNTYFPVYATDYIQLQKENVTSGMRHFYIDTDYAANFRTNANGYVNATVETEFYIAMPNGVLYQVGYDKLPTIKAENIRAAYAVANNTSTDASGYDYWIASVIVIEVNQLDNAYDSVSLMYYNPYETSGSVRFVQSLNSEWRAYQPDAEAEANIPVIPKTSVGGSASWGNHSWTGANYGFYEVYDSKFENGELTSGRVDELLKVPATDWDGHGIYAGTIQRIWGLTTSEYIDVDFQGRTYTGTPINDKDVHSVTVSSTYDVPIYRVNGQSTSDLRLGRRVTASDIQPGDEVILVYNRAGALAYIVDLGYRYWGPGSEYNPSAANSSVHWLWNTYVAIRNSQITVASGDGSVSFTANFAQYLDNDKVEDFPLPAPIADPKSITTMGGIMTIPVASLRNADDTAAYAAPTGYTLLDVEVPAGVTNYTVALTGGNIVVTAQNNYNLLEGVALKLIFDYDEDLPNAKPPVKANAEEDGGVGLPAADWQIVGMLQSTKPSSKRVADDGTNPQPGDMVDLYFTVSNTYEVESVTINAPASIAGDYNVTDVIGSFNKDGTSNAGGTFVKYYITFELPAGVVDLTINAVTDAVLIELPEGVTLGRGTASDGSTTISEAFTKGEDLTNKIIKLTVGATAELPETVTITMGGKTLAPTKDYTYNNTNGEIKFVKGTATSPIVIAGAVASKTTTLTLTLAGVAQEDITVQQNGKDAKRTPGKLEWTLDQGVACDIIVKTKAGLTASSVAGASTTSITFTEQADKSWKGTIAAASVGNSPLTSTITATYERVNLTLTVADTNVDLTVNDGADVTLNGGKYSVLKGGEVTITVAPKANFAIESVTAEGLTFTKQGNNYVAKTTETAAKTYTVTVVTIPTQVTISLSGSITGVALADSGVVALTKGENGAVSGTLTVNVGTNAALTQNGGSGPYTLDIALTVPAGCTAAAGNLPQGWTFDATTKTLTVSSSAANLTAAASATLTITYAPAP